MKFKNLTAPIYQNLFPNAVLDMDVEETLATCENCLMARNPTAKNKRFDFHLKCCTYYPFVPNFAVGAVLADTSGQMEFAKGVLRDAIKEKKYVLPIGAVAPVKYQLEFKAQKKTGFGRNEKWLCPYFKKDENHCGMWFYRGAVCTSFYCKSSYGSEGSSFWSGVSDYLTFAEMALMEEALIRLDFSPRQISEALHFLNRDEGTDEETKSFTMSPSEFRKYWRDYGKDPEAFYIKCYEIVRGFDKKDFKEMLGEQGQALQKKLNDLYGKLHEHR